MCEQLFLLYLSLRAMFLLAVVKGPSFRGHGPEILHIRGQICTRGTKHGYSIGMATNEKERYVSLFLSLDCGCVHRPPTTCSAHPPTHYLDEWKEEFMERVLATIWLGGYSGPHKWNERSASLGCIIVEKSVVAKTFFNCYVWANW